MYKEKLHKLLKETTLTDKEVKQLLNQIEEPNVLGLRFEEDNITVKQLLEETTFNIQERKDLSVLSDPEKPNNILLEGDNLNSLAYLNSLNEQVDIIYIDPPYNTGSREFTYKDTFKEKGSSWHHSSWLSFMNKRLLLSRELLKDDGVIFVSIDDNEQAQLKLLLDNVYGEENFIGTIIQDKGNSQNDAHSIQKNHEYVHVYTKSNARLYAKKPVLKKVFQDGQGWYYKGSSITTGGVGGALNRCPTLGYTIYYNPETADFIGVTDFEVEKARISNDVDEVYTDNEELINNGYVKIRPPKKGTKLGAWTWGLDNFNANRDKILISYNKTRGTYSVFKKKYVDENRVVKKQGVNYYSDTLIANSKSILPFQSNAGTSSLTEIFNFKAFNNPKSIEMLKYFISLHTNKNATVLDFFAGSGSTGQAVLELNKEDSGNRKVILCTNNEITKDVENRYLEDNDYTCKRPKGTRGAKYNEWLTSNTNFKNSVAYSKLAEKEEFQQLGICRSVTHKRLKSVIEGYTTPKGKNVDGVNANLIYLKCEK